jgi:acyl-CoA synthetase (AMP-forming)/AMP-acid ligase II
MIGNGMRATIWKDFTERFKIKEIREVYGVTEGNVTVRELLIQKITSRKHT